MLLGKNVYLNSPTLKVTQSAYMRRDTMARVAEAPSDRTSDATKYKELKQIHVKFQATVILLS